MPTQYNCEICSAGCTYEAMVMCDLPAEQCPTLEKLSTGEITDRRPTDLDPSFPSEFTIVKEEQVADA